MLLYIFYKLFSQEEQSLGIQCLKSWARLSALLYLVCIRSPDYFKLSQGRKQYYAFILSRWKVLKESGPQHTD